MCRHTGDRVLLFRQLLPTNCLTDNREDLQQFYKSKQAASKFMHHDLQAAEEVQYLQLTISIKNHTEESVMKHCLGIASKCLYWSVNVIHPQHFHSVARVFGCGCFFFPLFSSPFSLSPNFWQTSLVCSRY